MPLDLIDRSAHYLPPDTSDEPHLLFTNPGTLEIELVKLLGVSVKETSDPIGFFGTGLKYAMAATLRLGGRMTIMTGGNAFEIGSKLIRLRDKEFTQVTLNGEELGFTTELGKQWEPWMVVRELYSNALDESGYTSTSERVPTCDEGHTTIALYGECFLDVWKERSRYFLDLSVEKEIISSEYANVYPGIGRTVFYRGIRIHETQLPTVFRYNLVEDVTLTEDRTLKYTFTFDEIVEKTIISSTDPDFVRRALTSGELTHEGRLDFDGSYYGVEMSDAFRAVCAHLAEHMPESANKNAVRFYQKRTNTKQLLNPASLTRVQQMQLEKAKSFMEHLGCDHLYLYPITVVRWLGENVHGLAKDGAIYLGLDCFDRGTKYVASTLYEEYVHCHYGLTDCSRGLQTWLFDKVVTMAEELHGAPL